MQSGLVAAQEERTFIELARRAQIVQAAIDTIAEVGYGRASLARIAARIGISKGVISYHFAGKEELIQQVVSEIIEQGKAYMEPRILAEPSGTAMLRTYIETNLTFMKEHRNHMVAIVEIARSGVAADGSRLYGDADITAAVDALERLLRIFQARGEVRADFDPRVMAVAIRAAIDAVPRQLARQPDLDVDTYAREIANTFALATSA
jgi:AcrR family transcriptional regulator